MSCSQYYHCPGTTAINDVRILEMCLGPKGASDSDDEGMDGGIIDPVVIDSGKSKMVVMCLTPARHL